ncbi:MAG: TraR/DksA family transcriptional regulator [Treponema sp.]|nr:TraR/DksA family transcriptional regulator [Treponema sp.]
MDDKFVADVKEKLLAQRATILEALENQTTDLKNLVKPIESGDEADVASDVVDRQLLNSLGAQDQQRLTLIDNALERIRLGKYGICLACGKEIPQARLEALPYAFMCVNCASAEERRHR